jgi:hypothetical protein
MCTSKVALSHKLCPVCYKPLKVRVLVEKEWDDGWCLHCPKTTVQHTFLWFRWTTSHYKYYTLDILSCKSKNYDFFINNKTIN